MVERAFSNIPIPDPSLITTEQINKAKLDVKADYISAVATLERIIATRLEAMDKAQLLYVENLNRVPTVLDREISLLRTETEQRIVHNRELFEEMFHSRDIALDAAKRSTDQRLIEIDAYRELAQSQSATYLTRNEYRSAHESLERIMSEMRISLSTYVTRVDDFDKTASVDRAQLDKRLEIMNEFRSSLRDQTAQYITRSEHAVVTESVTGLKTDLQTAIAIRVSKEDIAHLKDDLDGVLVHVDARTRGIEKLVWMGLGGVVVLGTLIQFLMNGLPGHATPASNASNISTIEMQLSANNDRLRELESQHQTIANALQKMAPK